MIFSKIFGNENKRYLKKIQPIVEKINLLENDFKNLSDEKLKLKTQEFKGRLKKGENLDNVLPEAFAVVREAAKRTLGQRHFDVQLMGGIALHEGKIVEMKTGEGKTLVATLPLYLNALEEKGCHLVTVNDYLARRDTVWMGQIYYFLGLSVGCLNNEQSFLYDPSYKKPEEEKDKIRDELGGFKVVEDFLRPASKKEAYLADITYGTNNEFGFDYLRDNMVYDIQEKVQRGFNFAIVDEADSILIDEARTPLIISAPSGESTEKYYYFASLVSTLKEGQDYTIDEKMRVAIFTEKGQKKIIEKIGKDPWGGGDIITTHQLNAALQAKTIYLRDRDYIVKDGEIIIVDEFTGRLLPGRRFSGGIHQAIEAKERVEVKEESRTLATISFQNYFRMYKKLSGMTGTAATSAEEFHSVYGVDVVVIPTHLPMIRKDLPDRIYKTEEAKFRAVVEEVKKRNKNGQPVLIGTTSIEKNEKLGKLLDIEGIPHQILNAKNHQKEGEIIAQAGRLGAVTVATNMAGRGVDIILGGNPPNKKETERVRELGGLHVIGTERHESRRIDNQLRGRSGRQGDPGSSQFFISLEDDLARVFGGERIKALIERFNIPDNIPIENKMISNAIESAQARVEGYNFDLRKHLLDYDDVLNKQRDRVYKMRDEFLTAKEDEIENLFLNIVINQVEKILKFHFEAKGKNFEKKDFIEEIENLFQIKIGNDFEQVKEEIKNYLMEKIKNKIREKKKEIGNDFLKLLKFIQLRAIDVLWMEHLENMEALRDSVKLKAYGQIDPLVAYRIEGSKIFQELLDNFERQVIETILKVKMVKEDNISKIEEGEKIKLAPKRKEISKTQDKKIGRNDPCPCGSGKKYKKCCYPKYG